ncbi:hypothetical protein AKJ09_00161 [Labilithrix luteola]|uniref:Uncharacterized protein n=1 Tax=Labilithrix luteola TaxID=1391654 RepID=A0A0K1PIZ9_9BACT|nr:hypothetical protein AKJ09_00161 [Labilithrix luteola]
MPPEQPAYQRTSSARFACRARAGHERFRPRSDLGHGVFGFRTASMDSVVSERTPTSTLAVLLFGTRTAPSAQSAHASNAMTSARPRRRQP